MSDQLLHYNVDQVGKPILDLLRACLLFTLCSLVCAVSVLSEGFSFTWQTHTAFEEYCVQSASTAAASSQDWPQCMDSFCQL